MRYKDRVDNSIIKELLKNDTQFNELLRRLQVTIPGITQVTLNRHIVKLSSRGIIYRKEPEKIGKKGEIRISPIAREEIKLGIFRRPDYTQKKRRNISDEERMRNVIHLILSVASSGSFILKEVSKPTPGDIAIPISGDLSKGFRSYSVEHKEGFSTTDFFNKMWMGGNAGIHKDIQLSVDELDNILSILKEKSIVREISIGKEKRYGIVDNDLSNLVEDCVTLFSSTISRMKRTWTYRKPKNNEVDWMRNFFGSSGMLTVFSEAHNARKTLNGKNKKLRNAEKKEIERQIKLFDNTIKRRLIKVQTRNLKIQQYEIFSKILIDASYPEFIHKLQENHEI